MYSSRNISLESIQKVKVNGETLAYVMFPDESTQYDVRFLLLHGNMGSLFSWREVINGLSQRYVVALDLRGFGQSTLNNQINGIEDFATDVKLFCQQLKLERVSVIGWGLGGLVAMKLAEIAPYLLKNVVLVSSYSHLGKALRNPQGLEIKSREQIEKFPPHRKFHNILKKGDKRTLRKIFDMTMFPYFEYVEEDRKAELIDICFKQRHYLDTVYAMANAKIDLSKTGQAFWRVYFGKEDTVTPIKEFDPTLAELKRLGKRFSYRVYETGGHFLAVEFYHRICSEMREVYEFKLD